MATAYGDHAPVREALRLLAEILTQGRAADCSVMAFVQEPSKDVVEVRDLLTTKICLGVTAAVHVDMPLGEGDIGRNPETLAKAPRVDEVRLLLKAAMGRSPWRWACDKRKRWAEVV